MKNVIFYLGKFLKLKINIKNILYLFKLYKYYYLKKLYNKK